MRPDFCPCGAALEQMGAGSQFCWAKSFLWGPERLCPTSQLFEDLLELQPPAPAAAAPALTGWSRLLLNIQTLGRKIWFLLNTQTSGRKIQLQLLPYNNPSYYSKGHQYLLQVESMPPSAPHPFQNKCLCEGVISYRPKSFGHFSFVTKKGKSKVSNHCEIFVKQAKPLLPAHMKCSAEDITTIQ